MFVCLSNVLPREESFFEFQLGCEACRYSNRDYSNKLEYSDHFSKSLAICITDRTKLGTVENKNYNLALLEQEREKKFDNYQSRCLHSDVSLGAFVYVDFVIHSCSIYATHT